MPIADIEGHLDRQRVLLDVREKALEGFNAAAVQGLVVFHQQLYGAFAQHPGEGWQIAVVGEIAQRYLQPFGAERPGALQGGDQFGIGSGLPGQPELHGRRIDALQALCLCGIGQLSGVLDGQQFFAPLNARGAGGGENLDEAALAALTH
ncbi:hypothetical protein D3C84_816620 [compost metagenome]